MLARDWTPREYAFYMMESVLRTVTKCWLHLALFFFFCFFFVDATPASLDMEDQDVIDAVAQQTGGC